MQVIIDGTNFTGVLLDERSSRSKRTPQMQLHYMMSKIQDQVEDNYKISELLSYFLNNSVIMLWYKSPDLEVSAEPTVPEKQDVSEM